MRRIVVFVLVLVIALVLFYVSTLVDVGVVLDRVTEAYADNPERAAWLYTALSGVAFLVGTPSTVICGFGGALFGPARGIFQFSIGGLFACYTSFLLARFVLRDWVERKLLAKPSLSAVQRAVESEGVRFLAMARFLPVHGTLMSALLSTTRAKFWPFAIASVVQVPIWFVFVYLGYVTKETAVTVGDTGQWGELLPSLLGVAMFLTVMIYATRRVRKAVQRELDTERSSTAAQASRTASPSNGN
ncbi:MAG: VTT domain-containing protein [Bacteroidota bacterium]